MVSLESGEKCFQYLLPIKTKEFRQKQIRTLKSCWPNENLAFRRHLISALHTWQHDQAPPVSAQFTWV